MTHTDPSLLNIKNIPYAPCLVNGLSSFSFLVVLLSRVFVVITILQSTPFLCSVQACKNRGQQSSLSVQPIVQIDVPQHPFPVTVSCRPQPILQVSDTRIRTPFPVPSPMRSRPPHNSSHPHLLTPPLLHMTQEFDFFLPFPSSPHFFIHGPFLVRRMTYRSPPVPNQPDLVTPRLLVYCSFPFRAIASNLHIHIPSTHRAPHASNLHSPLNHATTPASPLLPPFSFQSTYVDLSLF